MKNENEKNAPGVENEASDIKPESSTNQAQVNDSNDKHPEKRPDGHDKKTTKSSAINMFIFLCGIFSLSYFAYFGFDRLQQIDNRLNTFNERIQSDALRAGKEIDALQDVIIQLEKTQEEQLDTLTAIHLNSNNKDWSIAEIYYLLTIAIHRLSLQNDVTTAITAMEAADDKIGLSGDLRLLEIRKQIIANIHQLRAVNLVDIKGLSLHLAQMIELADNLPLRSSIFIKSGPNAATTSSPPLPEADRQPLWREFTASLWQEIKSLIIISRTDKISQPLLTLREEFLLKQNLKLELSNARQSVLLLDSDNLHASVDISLSLIKQYFDTDAPAIINIMEKLKEIRGIDLRPELPDISQTLESLRAYSDSIEK